MKLRQCLLSLVVLAGLAGPLSAGAVTETWRSSWGSPRAVTVNPTDNSVWAAIGSSVVHLSADGTVLWRGDNFWGPGCVAVNAADGSCWVTDSNRNQVVHLSAAGEELWRGGGFVLPLFVSVNPGDGSVWVGQGGQNFATPEVVGEPEVIHLAADGTVLWRTNAYYPAALAVSPADGACWVSDYSGSRLVRLSPSGGETASVDSFAPAGQIGVGSPDGSVWVSDFYHGQVVRVSASGEELWRGGNFVGLNHAVVNPADGSLWVTVLAFPTVDPPPSPSEVVHLSASGTELWRRGGFRESSATTAPLAVSPGDGSLWVADAATSALVRLAADGTRLVRQQGFDDPVAVAVSAADRTVWVADQGRSRMVQVDRGGHELRIINDCTPIALAADPGDGTLWEVDFFSRVARFTSDGTELWHKDILNLAPIIAINPDDDSAWLAVGDTVIHLSANGDELWRGAGFGQISSLAVDPADDSCWLGFHEGSGDEGDVIRGHVVHLAAGGGEIWRSPEEAFADPCTISVDPRDQSIRVGDYSRDEVVSLTQSGAERWRTRVGYVPRSVAVDPSDGSCWVAAYGGSSVELLNADGTILWHGTGFSSPQSVSVDPNDGVCWVADTGDSQVVRLGRSRFSDVPSTDWAADAIYTCVAAGVVTGYWDGRYQPSLSVTRDQVAVYLARALAGGEAAVPAAPSRSLFADVGADQWASRHIAYCAEMGVVEGYPGGAYQPDKEVSRAQMAVYIARAIADPLGEEGLADYQGPSSPTFTDVPSDQWAWRYIEYAAAHGIAQGFPGGTYLPEAPVTRDQMAVFVARAFLQ